MVRLLLPLLLMAHSGPCTAMETVDDLRSKACAQCANVYIKFNPNAKNATRLACATIVETSSVRNVGLLCMMPVEAIILM